jgi:phosphoribosyl-ATP pyrophosphohydrolase/phosphoribosyl-AMP cyclohydrolase
MQAYVNKDALEKTLRTGNATYYSRSKKQLWEK